MILSRVGTVRQSFHFAFAVTLVVAGIDGCSRPVAPERPASPSVEAVPRSSVEHPLTEVYQLIARRLELMPGVAQAKWNRKLPITDEKREQALLTKLVAEGEALHLPADFVKDFFQAQITAAKLIQEQLFRDWTAQQHHPFETAPDLEKDVRPQIDEINRKMLESLAKCWERRATWDWSTASGSAQQASFRSKQWSEGVIETATKPLREIGVEGK